MANSFVIGQYKGQSHLGLSAEIDDDELPGNLSSGRFGNYDQPNSQRPERKQPLETKKKGSGIFFGTDVAFDDPRHTEQRPKELGGTGPKRRPSQLRIEGRSSMLTPEREASLSEGIDIADDESASFIGEQSAAPARSVFTKMHGKSPGLRAEGSNDPLDSSEKKPMTQINVIASEQAFPRAGGAKRHGSREAATVPNAANNSDIRVLLDKGPTDTGTATAARNQASPHEVEQPSTSEYHAAPPKSSASGIVSKGASTETGVFSKVIEEAPSQRIFVSDMEDEEE